MTPPRSTFWIALAMALTVPSVCRGDPSRGGLEVTPPLAANDCPDARVLAADVALALGRDALDATPGPDVPFRLFVEFEHAKSGYTASVRAEGIRRGTRAIAADAPVCSGLRQAVTVVLAVLSDELAVPPVEKASASAPSSALQTRSVTPTPPIGRVSDPVDEKDPPTDSPTEQPTEWYGWQTLLIDAGSMATVAMSFLAIRDSTWAWITGTSGVFGYLVGPPVVHALHGRPGMAGRDGGLRLGALLVGGLVGAIVGEATAGPCPSLVPGDGLHELCEGTEAGRGIVVGMFVGAAASAALDASVFARGPATRVQDGLSWHPTFAVHRGSVTGGFNGSF